MGNGLERNERMGTQAILARRSAWAAHSQRIRREARTFVSMTHVRSTFWRATAIALNLVCAERIEAQDSLHARLPTVRVTATREGPRAPLDLPYAVTLVRPDTLAALRKTGVDELLFAVPGVTLVNRQNPAQDPRVSIRGFGARSAFGVRGVRVLQDGVPVTLPDGQTPVDVLDLEGAERVEVVRGSASSRKAPPGQSANAQTMWKPN